MYWLPLYGVLEAADSKCCMVNGRQTRNLPGRKTDMQDCQWGATLHAHGLLRAGFVPPAHIRRLQDYLRLRADHISSAAAHVQHMQKALERMNIKLHDVISSLTGVSGLAVVRAILAGERDPRALLALCDMQNPARQGRACEGVACAAPGPRSICLRCGKPLAELGPLPRPDRRMRPSDRSAAARHRWQRDPPHIAAQKQAAASARASMPRRSPSCARRWRRCAAGQDLTQLPAHTEYSVLQIVG